MTQNFLKILFSDIIKGYSEISNKSFGKVFIKHFTIIDSAQIESKIEEFKQLAYKLPTLEEREVEIIKDGFWSDKQNTEIKDLKTYLSGLEVSKTKVHLKADIENYRREIKETIEKITKIEGEKYQLIGPTRETYAHRRGNDFCTYYGVYRDKHFEEPYFEDFDDLDDDDIEILNPIYKNITDNICPSNIKKIALSPFFMNIFYLTEDSAYKFYNKPVSLLTSYQVELFNNGVYFKHILSEAKNKIPPEYLDDPEALVEWFDSYNNVNQELERAGNKEGGATGLVGATDEDIQRLGLNKDENVIDIGKLAREKGGKINMMEMLDIHKM